MTFALELKDRFASEFLEANEREALLRESGVALENLISGKGKGREFLGWVHLPRTIRSESIQRISSEAERIRRQSDTIVLVGIGGSYLGARAVIDASKPYFSKSKLGSPEIVYAGHHLDSRYHAELLKYLETREFSINVISKSGTTTEPALAFRLLWDLTKKKYGDRAKQRIIATTDSSKGALRKMSEALGFTTFVIPDDVGGRYSVLTPVGLFPIAAAGIDIGAFVNGFQEASNRLLTSTNPEENLSCRYAALRNCLYRSGRTIEVLSSFTPSLRTFTEWWKQLYGESEGKDGKGIFPAGVNLTTDLHSMGQYLQEGERRLFETFLHPLTVKEDITIPADKDDLDGLNFLAAKPMSEVNRQAILGTLTAHSEGNVPCIELCFPDTNPENLGSLMYFFELACGISGTLLNVNPFDQPGVEAYKRNMFALLGKSGFENLREILKSKGI
ncbi:glucose-6-phosphate isomerase [Leptospira inadai serovar Lyme str. 10]|uniref:Glucose-6-phosphate isomerase n=2 Tax=Leptospira inadai serovar Lyme TaxID=293084 RepID=V6HUJ7_9LEPT|nr:glucose-6-phosphate isomerase [Leptospira inadai]EQA36449.1 glucose-6-phosphate isomerase [Leptospira inadai serovar Lyme str. 10]PNV75557.1 glucose-6-phosphate isomerase [Leptospira inadai serovar Lyme]